MFIKAFTIKKYILRLKRSYLKRLLFPFILLFVILGIILIGSETDHQENRKVYLSFGLNATFKSHPFYFKKVVDDSLYDISIVTQVSIDRLERLSWMADKWRAPISAAIYIKDESEVSNITSLIDSSYSVSQFVDFHLLYFNKTRYPVNTLRNLSIKNSNTKWSLLMDADFIPPLGLYNNLIKHIDKHNDKELVAYVVPSFASSLSRFELPDTKKGLIKAVEHYQTITPTNLNVCPKCHSPSNYTRWYVEDEPYYANYQWIYEPYLVFQNDQVDQFDERLKGYGFDKNSHTFGMAVQGFKFLVLPDAWIVHMNHKKQVWEGTDTYNEQMFDSLKIVCQILPDTKIRQGHDENDQLFGEPIGNKQCLSRDHW